MTQQNIQKHVRILSIIMIVSGILYLLATLLLGVIGLIALNNQAQTGDIAVMPAIITGIVLLFPLGFIAVLHILTGRAFRAGTNWARIALWILAIINLGNVPVGTAIGAYAMWVLVKTREDVKTIH
ncbi:MAG: hypothetical protein JRJ37_02310 [Deltaproteobacteria bacterium]|jgi:hypothetical protein|nr:hypothetical protein [Deltaproteobacteria bacterium]